MKAAVQVLKKAEELKQKLGGGDILSDNDTWNCHQRLQDLYQQLLLIDLEYALDKKVEQDLWNYVFKNQINVLQMQAKDRKNPQRSESQENLVWFLEASSGFYLQLIQELCETFDLDISCRRKGSSYGIPRDAQSSRNVIVPPHKSSCLYICQHCLVHLGDIARYRNQSLQAETWYRHAAELVPSNGQPYNQLAILEAAKGDKLSTVFYYVRSIAVKCPFPVAATNLQKMFSKIANDEFQHDGKNKLSVYDYVTAFLQFHSLIHLTADLSKAQKLGRVLATNLTILIATESLTAWKLIQMMAINLFAVAHATRGLDAMATTTTTTTTTTSIDKQQHEDFTDPEILSEDEQTAYNLVLELIASMLNSMLLLVYTMKDRHELKAYYALPVVKLVLEWLRQDLSHLKATSFTSKLQIWPSLCKLLNAVQSVGVSGFDFNKYTEVPLPEDWDLQSFVPMERAHRAYRFRESLPHLAVADEQSLRASRLVTMGRWLSEQEVYGVRLVTAQPAPDETLLFEAVSPQTPSCDVLEQLEAVAVRRSYEEEEDEEETTPLVSPTLDGEAETMDGSAGVLVDAEEVQTVSGGHRNRAKGGGGRPSVEMGSDGVGSIFGEGHHRPGVRNGGRERKTRQNVALQTIMQKKNIVTKNDHNGDDHFISTKPKSEGKQVTFKTPSPSPPASSGGTPPLQQHQPPQPHAATATPSPVFHGDMSCFPPLLALPYAQQQQQRQALNLDHNGGPHINSVSPNPVPNAAHNRLVYTNLQNSDHAYQLNNSAPPKFGYFGDSGPGRPYAGHPPTMPPPGQMTGRVGPPSAPKQLSNGDAGQHPTVNGLGQPPLHHLQQQQQQHRVPAMGPVDLSSAYPQPQQQQHGIVFGYPSPPKPNPASNPVVAINGGVPAPLGHLGQQKQSPEQQAHFPVGVFNPAAPSTWFVPPGPPMGPMAPYKPPPNLDQLLLQFNSQQRAQQQQQQQQSGNIYAANQQHNFGAASNPRFPPRDVNSYLYHHMMTSDHSMPPYAPYPAPQQQQHSVPLGSLPPTGRNSVAARKLVNGMSDPTYPEPPAHMAAAPSSLGGNLRQNVSDKHRGAVQQQQQSLSEVQSRAGGGKGMSEGGGSGSKSSSDNVASTYSLFNSPWSSGLNLANVGAKEHDNSNHAVSVTKDLGGFLQPSLHSLWSGPGPSPLERLLEQQKQKKDPAPH